MNRKALVERLLPLKHYRNIQVALQILAESGSETLSNEEIGRVWEQVSQSVDHELHPAWKIELELSQAYKRGEKPCECHKHSAPQFGLLPPLPGEKLQSYLLPLSYRRPKNLLLWPLYALRSCFSTHVKIYQSEVESVTWKKKGDCWQVSLATGQLSGIENIEPFIKMKNHYLQVNAQS